MTKIASILLLAVLGFNWVGYRLLSGFLEQSADKQLEASISSSSYDEEELIEMRVPLNAPYLAGTSGDFERYDGNIEVDGVHYKYVKRKIENGELVLLCLPNTGKTQSENSRIEFFKLVNDLGNGSQSKDHHSSSVFKTFTTEYKKEDNCWTIPPAMILKLPRCNNVDTHLSEGILHTLKHPPKTTGNV
jgi:hypothetical protein